MEMQTQALSLLVTQIIQAGLGAVAVALLLFSHGPRLRRVSRRVFKLERRFNTQSGVSRGTITPPGGVPVNAEDFDENTKG